MQPSGSLVLYSAEVNPTRTEFTRPISTVLKSKPLPRPQSSRASLSQEQASAKREKKLIRQKIDWIIQMDGR